MKEIEKNLDGKGLRIGILQSRFNPEICEGLLAACRAQLVQQGVASNRILPTFRSRNICAPIP